MEPRAYRAHATRGPERSRRPRPRRASRAPGASPRTPLLLRATRHWLAAAIVAGGIVAMAFGSESALIGGAGLVGAGIATWLIAWLYRVGIEGESAREEEEQARRRFTRTGRWS